MKIFGISLFVYNIEKMVNFYEEVLRMDSNWDGGSFAEFLMENNFHFMLYERKAFEELISQVPDYPTKINGTMEFALDVSKYTDVDNEFERVIKFGARPILEPTNEPWGQRTCYVADPEGNLIEIASFGKEEQ